MAITNLTNTKWVINETPDISSASELFNLTFNSHGNSFTKFNLGVFVIPLSVFQLRYEDTNDGVSIVCDTNNGWTNQAYRIIEITGGNDVTNSTLIQWLEANAVQVQVTSLVNTKWVWNDVSNLKSWGQSGILYRSWTTSGGNNFEGYYFNIEARLTVQGSGGVSISNCYYFMGTYNATDHSNGSVYWSKTSTAPTSSTTNYDFSNVILMEFTGGTDIANPDLIAWLSQNATLQQPTPTKTFDLSTLQLSAGTHEIKVKARATGYRDSEFSNSVSYEAGRWSCVVAGLGSENPSNVTFTHTGTMPTFEEVTVNSNVFIKIHKMYRKVLATSDNQITSFEIANYKKDNDFVPYTCFVKEDGTTEMDYVLIGKYYSNSTSVMNSVNTSGETQQIGNARTHAQALGTGYQLYDWQMHKLWQDLIICKKNTINTNSGSGIGTNKYDDFGIYWDIWGGFVDGVLAYRGYWKFSYKPSEYVTWSSSLNPTNYIQASYGIPNGYREIKSLGYDASNPFFNYPSLSISVSSYTTYYCDELYTPAETQTSTRPIRTYVTSNNTPCGAFGLDIYETSGTYNACARLCYRPIFTQINTEPVASGGTGE